MSRKNRINLEEETPTPVVEETTVEEETVAPVVETTTPEVVVEAIPTPVVEETVEYPEVSANGKYQYVQVGDKYVIYNPIACRVSGLLTLTEAADIVRNQNLAAQIKG